MKTNKLSQIFVLLLWLNVAMIFIIGAPKLHQLISYMATSGIIVRVGRFALRGSFKKQKI